MSTNRKRIADFAVKSRLPSMYGIREFVEDGGLMFLRNGPSRTITGAPRSMWTRF